MHVAVIPSGGLTSELIHFTTALLITLLLLVLTIRAARLPGTPVANMLFAVCGILWSAGGLVHALLRAAGFPRNSFGELAAHAVQFAGAAAFPIAILAVWHPFATLPWQRKATRALEICASISAIGITILVCYLPNAASSAAACNAALFLAAGAVVTLRKSSTPRAIYFPSVVIVTALCGAALMTLGHGMEFLAAHLILLTVLFTFLLFARFRFADVFIRQTLRIMLAAVWAGMLAGIATAPTPWQVLHQALFPQAMHAFLLVLGVNGLIFSFTFVDTRLNRAVNRWLFRAPDYRGELRTLALRLRTLQDEREIALAVEEAARRPLELGQATVVVLDGSASWPAAVREGETVERGVDLLIPMASGGHITHLLQVTPGPTRPGLVSRDVDYLRSLGVQFGNRLDALLRERDAVERQSREALLLQQVTEAELRALRAQINPHFLFNSLNTVADLIVRDPVRAEAMTLRLAGVFRHVLAHSSRPLTTVRDEIEFLRTYLYIEEARFGDRLQVKIDVDAGLAGEQVPSLILQPLVENAIKHGLGPKPGPGHLWISAHAEAGQLILRVEDDGMGLDLRRDAQGLGLSNVAERLATLYQDRASLTLEPREGGRVPRDATNPPRPGGDGMKCLIVDDEPSARARLRRLLAVHPEIAIAGEACDGLEALEKIEELRPDLLFLDIELPGLSGFELLRSLPGDVTPPLVIFVTGYDQHALAAFEANALAYLLKPVETERLAAAVERACRLGAGAAERTEEGERLRRIAGESARLLRQVVCRKRDRMLLLAPTQILWFQVEDGIVKAHTADDVFWVNSQLSELEGGLPPEMFFRARREVLVNLQSIKEIRPYFKSGFLLSMADAAGTEIVVSERQARLFRQRIPGL